jgi:hypothetical protein
MLAVDSCESLRDRGIAADDFEGLTGGVGRVQNPKQYRRDVFPRDAAASGVLGDRYPSRTRVVGQQTWTHDRRG